MACAMAMPLRFPSGATCRTSSAQARRWAAQALRTMELEEAPRDNPNGTRSASRADHHRVARHRDRRSVEGAGRAGRPCGRAPLLGTVFRPAAGGCAGGDDRLAVRGRGAAADRSRGASRRAGGHGRVEGQQEACQERPRRRPASARAADRRQGARVVDRARAHSRSARAGATAPCALGRPRRVAAADPVGALSPRLSQARRPDQPGGTDVAGHAAAAGVRARAGHRRAGDDRRARPPARAARQGSFPATHAASPAARH